MRRPLSLATRKELIEAVRQRYQEAALATKTDILDEFVELTGYHRKHAVRLLGPGSERKRQKKSRSDKRVYNEAVREALILLWEAADRICGKRLKALIPTLLAAMEKHGHLQLAAEIRERLLQMSAATIDRLLTEPRERVTGTRRRKGVGATVLRRSIPIRTFGDWNNPEPGYMESDLVAHCGGSMAGSVVHTLVLTDIATGWTECVPLIVRDQALIVEALEQIRKTLPFPLRGFDTDNDGAFINQTIKPCSTIAVEPGWSSRVRALIERTIKRGWNRRTAPSFASSLDTTGSPGSWMSKSSLDFTSSHAFM